MPDFLPPANIPEVPHSETQEYQDAKRLFEESIDTTYDPCDNFYEYTCANKATDRSFDKVARITFTDTFEALKAPIEDDEVRKSCII